MPLRRRENYLLPLLLTALTLVFPSEARPHSLEKRSIDLSSLDLGTIKGKGAQASRKRQFQEFLRRVSFVRFCSLFWNFFQLSTT
jgi:hypothetical protein